MTVQNRLWFSVVMIGAGLMMVHPNLLSATPVNGVEVFKGVARNDRGEIAYIEEHRLVYEQGRHQRNQTRYFDASGKEFAVLTSQFGHHPYVPEYDFEDRRFGRRDGARIQAGFVSTYGQPSQQDARRENLVRLTGDMITGQGLHFFFQDHLDTLAEPDGAVKKVKFLIPLEGKDYVFRIRRIEASGEAPGTATFRIEIDNWVLRMFAPYLEVRYDLASKRLLSYRGVSNLLDANRQVQNVVITYQYRDNAS